MHKTNMLTRLVSAVYRHQLAYLCRKLTPYNIGGGSYIFLVYIHEYPGITQMELSSLLMIDRATVSKMLAHLEKEGLIRRFPNPEDGRAVLLEITARGEELSKHLFEIMENYRSLALDGISPEDYRVAITVLEKVLANIRKHTHEKEKRKATLRKN